MNALTLEEINNQINYYKNKLNEYENKLNEFKKEKMKRFNLIKYFNISKNDVKKLKNYTLNIYYNYNDHALDEYGHDAEAFLHIKYGNTEYLKIDYKEEQGCGTESRYSPTIYCEINGTKKAKQLLFKNVEEIDLNDLDNDETYQELRDIIKNITDN